MTAHVQLTVAQSVNKNCKILTIDIQFWVAADVVYYKCFVASFNCDVHLFISALLYVGFSTRPMKTVDLYALPSTPAWNNR